jgi:hypothetical protein
MNLSTLSTASLSAMNTRATPSLLSATTDIKTTAVQRLAAILTLTLFHTSTLFSQGHLLGTTPCKPLLPSFQLHGSITTTRSTPHTVSIKVTYCVETAATVLTTTRSAQLSLTSFFNFSQAGIMTESPISRPVIQ